jgi:hypothetical protein
MAASRANINDIFASSLRVRDIGEGQASVRSRIACQRMAGSESSSQSMGSTPR